MAENYKRLYEVTKKMLVKYQDEVVPELRKLLDERVEVVRCKDCKHFLKAEVNGNGFLICSVTDKEIYERDFCSYGERRSE